MVCFYILSDYGVDIYMENAEEEVRYETFVRQVLANDYSRDSICLLFG